MLYASFIFCPSGFDQPYTDVCICSVLQRPLNKGTTVGDPNKEHPQQLCGKCRRLGYSCIEADSTDD